jgi:hypothetical protein
VGKQLEDCDLVFGRLPGRAKNLDAGSLSASCLRSTSCMMAVVVATILVSDAASKMDSSVMGRAFDSYVANPNGT